MDITCVLFGPLREDANAKELSVSIDEGATILEVLRTLEKTNHGLENGLLGRDETLRQGLVITLNKRHVNQLEGNETPVSDGDIVRISPSIQGG